MRKFVSCLSVAIVGNLLACNTAAAFLFPASGSITGAPPSRPSTVVTSVKKRPTEAEDIGPIDPKREALEGVLYQIERSYGRGSILKLGETQRMAVECTSTGSLTLDIATGGGYPKGRVIEIYGPESSGKTTLALHAIAEVQKAGGYAAFIDAEHALDPTYAAKVGVDTNQLLISQPDCGEMALDIVDQLIRSQAVDIVVVDSVAALVPRAELEGDMGDTQIGLQARLMSKALRKITGSLAKSKCTVIFLNQLRSKVGVFFGNPEVTSGGNALKYFSSMRLDIRRKEVLKDETGIHCKVKVVKNKVAPPFKVVEMDILFGRGIDKEGGLVDAAESIGVLERRGAWFSYKGNNVAQGRAKLAELLVNDVKLRDDIAEEVRAKLNPVVEFLEAKGDVGDDGDEDLLVDGDDYQAAALPSASSAAAGKEKVFATTAAPRAAAEAVLQPAARAH